MLIKNWISGFIHSNVRSANDFPRVSRRFSSSLETNLHR